MFQPQISLHHIQQPGFARLLQQRPQLADYLTRMRLRPAAKKMLVAPDFSRETGFTLYSNLSKPLTYLPIRSK